MSLDKLTIAYTLQLWRDGDYFVAHAMPLDVMSTGKTEEEARYALDEAVSLFLKTAADIGTLEQVLEDAGYVFRGEEWEEPAWVSVEGHTLSVAG